MVLLPNCGERSSRSMVWYAAPYLEKWVGKTAFSLSTRASHRGVVPGILISDQAGVVREQLLACRAGGQV